MLGIYRLLGGELLPGKRCGHSMEGMAAAGGLVDICSCGCAVLKTRFGREKAPPAEGPMSCGQLSEV